MNVAYDKFNTLDVSKIVGVAPQTITAWVRNGYIKAINVSDGTNKPRYMFTDDEVTRVNNLIKVYGTRKWMLYSKNEVEPKKEIAVPVAMEIKKIAIAPPTQDDTRNNKFNADKIMNKILKLQDLKERLEDIEAERNQLINEIEAIREEIKEVL